MKYNLFLFILLAAAFFGQAQTPCSFTQGKPKDKKYPDELFLHYEVMPQLLIRGVNEQEDPLATDKYLLRFIHQHFRHPPIMRQNQVSGVVVISFTIGTDGLIDAGTIQCVRDIGGGFGDEGVRIVQLMATLGWRWSPGTFMGKPVPTRFNLPIRVRLE